MARPSLTKTEVLDTERQIGRGGMAVVYLARDLRHNRPVALTLLSPELAESVGSERFLREIAARLNLDVANGVRVVSRRIVLEPFSPPQYDDYHIHPNGRTTLLCGRTSGRLAMSSSRSIC